MKALVKQRLRPPVNVSDIRRALVKANTPEEIIQIEAKLDAVEQWMHDTGLYDTEEIRPINETRMWARWKLGQALAGMERGKGPGRGKREKKLSGFTSFLSDLGLTKPTAMAAQRIGTLPERELEKALTYAKKVEPPKLTHFTDLLELARPYWYQASRKAKHKKIKDDAKQSDAPIGPFPLIYADPPWKFQTYSEKGLDRTPDQHYPTLTDDEIINFKVGDISVVDISTAKAALLLWCTSANLERALQIMDGWGFIYKTHAIWVKTKENGSIWTGMGLVFRNAHEILLYGTKGAMPGPQYQPPSVFLCPRGKHSAKPPEIRKAIERMYPDFDADTRLELFSRDNVPGWTSYGFESFDKAAE